MKKQYTQEELNEIFFGLSSTPDLVGVYKNKRTGEIKKETKNSPCRCSWVLLGKFLTDKEADNFIEAYKGGLNGK